VRRRLGVIVRMRRLSKTSGLVLAASLGLVLAMGGGTAQPSPGSVSSLPPNLSPPLTADQLAPAPPESVQATLGGIGKFVPLTAAQLAEVSISRSTAAEKALSLSGASSGGNGPAIVWKEIGCIFLGWFSTQRFHLRDPAPPPYAAYFVQVVAHRVPAVQLGNVGVWVVDARTGQSSVGFGGGSPPFGVLATTCGVNP